MERGWDMGELIRHTACPSEECGSSDAFAIYKREDGTFNGYCYSCGKDYQHIQEDGDIMTALSSASNVRTLAPKLTIEEVEQRTSFGDITPRGIKEAVAEMYGVRIERDEATNKVVKWYYPLYVKDKFAGYKYKSVNKSFGSTGNAKQPDLFGKHMVGNPRKMIIITEGEDDAMAAKQMFFDKGKDYAVVSLPNGANKQGLRVNVDWLEQHQHIVLCFDQDEPGKKITKEAIDLFSPGKVKTMTFSEKDANAMLQAGKTEEFYKSLFQATAARPDGIISGADTWDRIKNRPKVDSIPYPDGWNSLNRMTYGMRIGELDTWTSGSGMGKTQVVRILQKHLLEKTEDSIGIIALEEPLEDTVEALMALEMRKRISLPDVRGTISDEEMHTAWKAVAGGNRIHLYDHFGSVDDNSLIKKITYMAKALDCKYIFLDHLSIVVSEFASEGGERERIDSIMTKLKNLTQSLGIWLGLIVHLRKTTGGGKSFEEGAVPTLDDLRGSGSIKQLSNNVYALSRDQQAEDDDLRNTSHLHVLKCRFTGRTGPADFLFFDDKTGWMTPVDNPAKSDGGEKEF
jgi:twinkle protein